MNSRWTAAMDEVIRANFGKLSNREIGKLLGVSKNAVCGRCSRIGLTQNAVRGPRKPKPVHVEKAPIAPIPTRLEPLNIPFMDLESFHCREIVGKDDRGFSLSCGHPKVGESSYCAFHRYMNTQRANGGGYEGFVFVVRKARPRAAILCAINDREEAAA